MNFMGDCELFNSISCFVRAPISNLWDSSGFDPLMSLKTIGESEREDFALDVFEPRLCNIIDLRVAVPEERAKILISTFK